LATKKHLGFAWHFFAAKSSAGEMRVVALDNHAGRIVALDHTGGWLR